MDRRQEAQALLCCVSNRGMHDYPFQCPIITVGPHQVPLDASEMRARLIRYERSDRCRTQFWK